MIAQTPAPPAPTALPEWIAPLAAVLAVLFLVGWLVMPLIRAWARRIENRGLDTVSLDDLAQMRERVAELELSSARVLELEERLDFAERLLAQRNEVLPLPTHRTPA